MINRWLALFLAINTAIPNSVAVLSADLSNNENDRLACDLTGNCTSWYNTSHGDCQSGYLRSDLLAQGSLPGSTCQKKCSNDEASECSAEWCKFNTAQCNLSPESPACKDALNWCKTPIKMSEKICTAKFMKSPMKYDLNKGTCSPDKNSMAGAEYHLSMDLGPSDTSNRLIIGCAPLTQSGVQDMYNAIHLYFKPMPCISTASKTLFPKWKCSAKYSQFNEIKRFAAAACKKADRPGSKKPVFESRVALTA